MVKKDCTKDDNDEDDDDRFGNGIESESRKYRLREKLLTQNELGCENYIYNNFHIAKTLASGTLI